MLAADDGVKAVEEAREVSVHVDGRRLAVLGLGNRQRLAPHAQVRLAGAGCVVEELRHLVTVDDPPRVLNLLGLIIHDAHLDKVVVQAGPPVYMFLDDVLVLVLGPLGVFRLRLLRLQGRMVRQERVRVPDPRCDLLAQAAAG